MLSLDRWARRLRGNNYRQPQLCDCGCASDGRSVEPGKCRGSPDDHAVGGETGRFPQVFGRRYNLWEW
jgi:hypothetical protein